MRRFLQLGLMIIVIFAVGVAQAVTVQTNVDISRRRNGEAETAIAIDPSNPLRIFALSNVDGSGSGLFSARSVDGGATWTTQILSDGSGDALITACCDPSVSFDTFGNLWMGYINAALNAVELGLSTDGGATWTNEGPVATGDVDQPTVTTGPKDSLGGQTVWMTYLNNSGKPSARGAEVTALGTHTAFGTEEEVLNTDSLCTALVNPDCGNFGDIAVGPDGQLLVAYQIASAGEAPATIYANLDDDGLGPDPFGSAVAVTATNVGGFDFIPAQSSRSVDAEAGFAYDRSGGTHDGRVYLVYTDEATDESNDTNVMIRSSDDDGATWTPAAQVNDDATTRSQFLPRISLDQTTGGLAVMWLDARNDDGSGPNVTDVDGIANTDGQLYGTLSADGGTTFAPNFEISQGTSHAATAASSTDYGDYLGLSYFDGVFFPIWSDNSNSIGGNPDGTHHQFDVYTSKVSLTEADVSVTATDSADPIDLGDSITYSISVANAGAADADSVFVIDPLPSGMSFVSSVPSQGGCSGTTTVTCNLGTLLSGNGATIDIVVHSTGAGIKSNKVSVSARLADPNLSNNSITVSTQVIGPPSVCGNGIKEANEQCDDGNTISGDGCSSTCHTEAPPAPVCGNGTAETGEECDDGNTVSDDGCSATCQTETSPPICGNGAVETGETCDDGNTASGDGCDSACQAESPPAPPKKGGGGCALIRDE